MRKKNIKSKEKRIKKENYYEGRHVDSLFPSLFIASVSFLIAIFVNAYKATATMKDMCKYFEQNTELTAFMIIMVFSMLISVIGMRHDAAKIRKEEKNNASKEK